MKTISAAIQIASDHKAFLGLAFAWLVREIPLLWKSAKSAYPALKAAGGIRTILRNIIGPKQFPAVVQATNPTPAIAERPAGDSGEPTK